MTLLLTTGHNLDAATLIPLIQLAFTKRKASNQSPALQEEFFYFALSCLSIILRSDFCRWPWNALISICGPKKGTLNSKTSPDKKVKCGEKIAGAPQ